MIANDWILMGKKVTVGVIVAILPLFILVGALWISESVLR